MSRLFALLMNQSPSDLRISTCEDFDPIGQISGCAYLCSIRKIFTDDAQILTVNLRRV